MHRKRLRYHLTATPPTYLARQAARALFDRLWGYPMEQRRLLSGTGVPERIGLAAPRRSFLPPAGLQAFEPGLAHYLARQYRDHRYDLLGCGWLDSGYDARAPGLAGHRYRMNLELPADRSAGQWLSRVVHATHLPQSRRHWDRILAMDSRYVPIDWQRDRKSGFRWSAQLPWYRQSALSRGVPGVDVLQAWELGRLQHLPTMVLIAGQFPDLREELVREIRCQLLDFAAANPPGMGINWSCTMDVAIRGANMVLCQWLSAPGDAEVPEMNGWAELVGHWIYQHGHFIRHHLEYNAGNTGNHFLANVVGLLFCAAALEPASEVIEWERFAVGALCREALRQFYPDGGHFEGSTAYHALCTEMLAYGLALAQGNRAGLSIPETVVERLAHALSLLERVTGPTGSLVQFGDNDSGRLFRLVPRGCFMTLAEARSLYTHLAEFPGDDPLPWFDENLLDYSEVTALGHGATLSGSLIRALSDGALHSRLAAVTQGQHAGRQAAVSPGDGRDLLFTHRIEFAADGDLREGLEWFAYPDSGIYGVRSARLYLAVSAHTNREQKLNLSHNHNDKMAVELYLDGRPILTDPGTYLYTPLPEERDRFRSVEAHNTLLVAGVEQNRFVDSFLSYPDADCRLLDLSPLSILLELNYRGVRQRRHIGIRPDAVVITDSSNRPFRQGLQDFPWESPGYGKLRRRG